MTAPERLLTCAAFALSVAFALTLDTRDETLLPLRLGLWCPHRPHPPPPPGPPPPAQAGPAASTLAWSRAGRRHTAAQRLDDRAGRPSRVRRRPPARAGALA